MPELPEVETSRRGIAPHVSGQIVTQVIVRQPRLRWPVTPGLAAELTGRTILSVGRRGKYLLLEAGTGSLILHLGMSGSLRILPRGVAPGKHDHVDICFAECCLRFHDPRRFGALLWTRQDPFRHPLLANLGPEPLGNDFNAGHLFEQGRNRRRPVKSLLMDGRIVAGVGNIYANEALYRAGIHPGRAAGRISRERYARVVTGVKDVLAQAIEQGGTSLRDFTREDGRPGYFSQELRVYGRAGEPCLGCGRAIRQKRLGQRSSFYCLTCQT